MTKQNTYYESQRAVVERSKVFKLGGRKREAESKRPGVVKEGETRKKVEKQVYKTLCRP